MVLKQVLKRLLFARKQIKVMPGTFIGSGTTIGKYSYVGFNCLISKSTIGRYVSIANNVNIGHGEHEINRVSTNTIFYNDPTILTKLPLVIEDDAWIGTGAIILRGVTIGRGAIIGAGAVVTKDVPPYAIAIGIPAKVIRYRFSSEIIHKIENSQWWEKDSSEAQPIIAELEKLL